MSRDIRSNARASREESSHQLMEKRRKFRLDLDWKFSLAEGELAQPALNLSKSGSSLHAAALQFDDTSWRTVDVPHDFVVEREFAATATQASVYRGSKPGGVAWYRKRFVLPADDHGRRIYIHFDGIYRDSQVYVNEFFAGAHPSGYTSFFSDITEFLRCGEENLIAVRVDATQDEGWWYEGGGIYRHVWLEKTGPVHVVPWGTCVTSDVTIGAGDAEAVLDLRTSIINKLASAATVTVRSRVFGPDGMAVGETESPVNCNPWSPVEVVQEIRVDHARLWSLDHPEMYSIETSVLAHGEVIDRYLTPFGIRSIRFDADRGFLLNGHPVKIKGVCCHQDHAGVGIAVPDAVQEYRLRILKDMGCNGYRCSHHPPSPELLDLCDRLGILVLNENRLLSTSAEDMQQLESMLRRDRNHPSVIAWSLGNEEVGIQWKPQSVEIARSLRQFVRSLDATRPVTMAICFWDPALPLPVKNQMVGLDRTPAAAQEVDIMSINYSPDVWEGFHAQHPAQPMLITEATTSLRTRGVYASNFDKCHVAWDDERCQPYHEEQWDKVARLPYVSGVFLWTGFDYRGEPTPTNSWPAVNSHFGILDTCGFPKDNYFYYRGWWRDEPLVHLFPHWNWPDRIGKPVKVFCYSNCDAVELLLNGVSLGCKEMRKNYHLEWDSVIYEPGVLEARGFRGGLAVVADRVETTGAPRSIRLTASAVALKADRQDAAVVNAAVVDEEGRIVPGADAEISFSTEGPGAVIGVGNGDPSSHEPDKSNRRRAFHGHCQVIVQAADTPGMITLRATLPGLRSALVEIAAGESPGETAPLPHRTAQLEHLTSGVKRGDTD